MADKKPYATLTITGRRKRGRPRKIDQKVSEKEELKQKKRKRSPLAEPARFTEKQAAFIRAIKENPTISPTEAARRAGYSPSQAGNIAYNLMANPKIKKAIGAFKEALMAISKYSAKDIIEEIDNLAMSNIANVVEYDGKELKVKPLDQISPQHQRTIKTIEQKEIIDKFGNTRRKVKVELHPKTAALDLAAAVRNLKEDMAANQKRTDSIFIFVEGRTKPLPKGPDSEDDVIDINSTTTENNFNNIGMLPTSERDNVQ